MTYAKKKKLNIEDIIVIRIRWIDDIFYDFRTLKWTIYGPTSPM